MKCQTSVPGRDVIWSLQAQGSGGVCGYFKQILIHSQFNNIWPHSLGTVSGDRTGSQRVPALVAGVFLVVLQGDAVPKFIQPASHSYRE